MPTSVPDNRDGGGYYGFSARNAERIATAVRRVEAKYQNDSLPQRRRSPHAAGVVSLIPLSIISAVTAGSEATPSAFSAKVLVPSGTSHGWTSAGQPTITCYNRAAGVAFTASSGTPKSAWGVMLESVIYLVAADC